MLSYQNHNNHGQIGKTMNREIFSQWFGGPLLHTHLQIENQIVIDPVENHQFTQNGIVNYLAKLSGIREPLVSDTNHALIDIYRDKDNWERSSHESRQKWNQRRIDFGSLKTLQRRNQLLNSKGVLTGVEVDIVGENGELSLTNDVLGKLDVVIAALHWRTWNGFQGPDKSLEESKNKIIKAYLNIANNPLVDILGHPTVFPEDLKNIFTGNDFIPILNQMKNKNVAMEVNLSVDLRLSQHRLERDLISVAAKINTPLSIGSDIHHLKYYELLGVYTDTITKDNWQEAFNHHSESGWHFNLFRFLAKNIKLMEDLGVNPKQIINSSYENFDKWFRARKT